MKGESDAERRANAETARAALESLRESVPQVRALTVGVDLGESDGNWDVVLVLDVDSREDLEGYIAHPAHVEVAGLIASLRGQRACVDHEL